MSHGQKPLLFGPASNGLPSVSSTNSLLGNISADSINLGEIFDDHFFPDDLDFEAFFQDLESGVVGDHLIPRISSPMSLGTLSGPQSIDNSGHMRTSSDEIVKVPLPIRMPKVTINSSKPAHVKTELKSAVEEGQDGDMRSSTEAVDSKRGIVGISSSSSVSDFNARHDNIEDVTVKQKLERRERNREHAKRSRIRKKVLLDSLQDELILVREENIKLRRIVAERMPHAAPSILENCTALESSLLASMTEAGDSPEDIEEKSKLRSILNMETNTASMVPDDYGKAKQHAKILMEPDYRLIHSLVISQQNFVLSDPSLPDNPIVYASEGFCKLSGYKRDEILGRNCRFLQGPGTDHAAVDLIRQGVAAGKDISVCLLNYKADGTPFWNQFFVGALRDSEGNVVNFVGVQCEVNIVPVTEIKDRVKKLPIPDF